MTQPMTPLGDDFTPEDPYTGGFVYLYSETVLRPVLNEAYYEAVAERARDLAAREGAGRLHPQAAMDVVDWVLAAVGFLAPPPPRELTDETCNAMWPDMEGGWHQCTSEPHGADDFHDDGEYVWKSALPNAVPDSRAGEKPAS